MMKVIKYLAIVAFVAMFAACSSLRTSYDYDKGADFSKYKAYAFLKEGLDKLKVSDLDKKRIVNAIEQEMGEKGFTKSDNPDVLINILAVGKEKISVTDTGPYYGWWGYPGGTQVRQYTEGTLYIDLIDRATKQLVWQGKGVDEFRDDVKDRDAKINEAIKAIMSHYPPGAEEEE